MRKNCLPNILGKVLNLILIPSAADPDLGSWIQCFCDLWTRDPDPGWKKIQSQDPG